MKYRKNKVKREHGIIEGALLWLEELGRQPGITDIIPGVIEVSRSPERGMVYKYETRTGCKLLLKSNGSVQEAFVVTKNPAVVREWVERNFAAALKEGRAITGAETVKTAESKPDQERKKQIDPAKRIKADQRPRKWGKDDSDKYHFSSTDYSLPPEDLDSPNIGQMLNPRIRQKMRALQQNLSQKGFRKQ